MDYEIKTVNFPAYAVGYFEYGEIGEDLNAEDVENIDKFTEELNSEYAPEGYHFSHFEYGEMEPTFCSRPAFGLPCDCYEGVKAVFFKNC